MERKRVEDFILEFVKGRMKRLDIASERIDNNISLLEQGVLDSIGFVEFLAELETEFDFEIDFEDLDVSDFTSITQLVELVCRKIE